MSTVINIARVFSKTPGPRFIDEGPHSGEDFRERLLRPAFEAALKSGEKVTIELDGVQFGYPTSFLEEAFGGLARAFGIEPVLAHLVFQSLEEPSLHEEIRAYILDANRTSTQRGTRAK